ncbi:hypothetical protein TVAG_451200 [Trichomonas vaginalis G3]|uniref:Protein HGH1 homolog n=1 Tax=Trichomonas vaginalis (strain ATCC PRA-98 / G3) TaxID=412133 RepID=A2EYS2_TRIV3|nr:armadillo (ARM) repeat-containing protein family [Trichomonas vaginalis G3]EAY02219.1 hypothetical protein TVAG_451200 [Trichomonas vaginalis G3]KAI5501021.1 armadillo (ARM) repeat-containing protein family [Trichomonas vaginalis G3]|eukprot:XP_001314557.1 hypothetical protein [Trichomonas vaginalis G3]
MAAFLLNNARDLNRLPFDFVPKIREFLTDIEFEFMQNLLNFLVSITTTYDGCRLLKKHGLVDLILEISEELPFVSRKASLKILLDMLDETDYEPTLVNFLIEKENLEIFDPFFETNDEEILSILLRPLSKIVIQARVDGPDIPPLFEVFANSSEILDQIRETADLDPFEHRMDIIEMSQYIISEMEGNFQKLNSQ